jgi:hypothetical protein
MCIKDDLRRLHFFVTVGKHATDRHNKMFLRLEAALERALEDPAQIPTYLAEVVKAEARWKPRNNRNHKFIEALRASPDWLAQKSNGDFCMPAEQIKSECDAQGIIAPHPRNIDKERRLFLRLSHQRQLAAAIRMQGGVRD